MVLLQGVPRAIPLQDVSAALEKQGVSARAVERLRHLVRVELQDAGHFDGLLRDGLDFFGAVRFPAVAERPGPGPGPWRRDVTPAAAASSPSPVGDAVGADQDNVLQCYRCQVLPGVRVLCGSREWCTDVAEASPSATLATGMCVQGFWHVAGNCRHLPRCVRCGEPHTVEYCPRPRNDPICCHCAGGWVA